jgi:FkbM family methyltransferase
MTARAVYHHLQNGAPKFLIPCEVEDYFLKCEGGYPERPLIEWAAQFLNERSVFVDIGAHCGTWALTLASKCMAVHAFEPQRESYSMLQAGVLLNGLQKKIRPHRVALSDDTGETTLRIRSLDGGGSSICKLPAEALENRTANAEERVRFTRLDKILGREPRIDLVKIDVEGAELAVIRGAREALQSSRMPPLIFEAWSAPWYAERKRFLIDYVESLGYKVEPIRGYVEMFLASHPLRTRSTSVIR